MCEIDADVVFQEFSTKASPGDSLESKKFKKENVFILFDRVNQLSTNDVKTVYVLDGDYLRPSFKKQLYETPGDDTTSFSLWCNDVIHSHEIKVSSPRSGFNVVGCLHDFRKLSFISMVGGFVSNREIERMSTRKTCKEVIHSLFSFFMALFCQVFSGFKLNQQFVPMVEFVDDKRVEYASRFSVCGDGHVFQTIKYKTANNGSVDFNVLHDGGQSLESVYKSPILDINIQIGSETNGYYPGCKDSYCEHLFGKDIHTHRWQQNRFEDCGIKHLYEFHHACTGDESCDFCNETTRPFGLENFFVENEEMCCHNSNPNYDSLRAINNERLTIDK